MGLTEELRPLILRKFVGTGKRPLTEALTAESLGMLDETFDALLSKSLALISWDERSGTEVEPRVLKKQFAPWFLGK